MRQQGKFYWDVILVATLFVSLSVIFLHFIFYVNKWDFHPFAGLAKPMMSILFIAPATAILSARGLLQKKGYASFLEIFVHFLIVGMVSGGLFGTYSYVFDAKIAPKHREEVYKVHIAGIAENCKQVYDKEKKIQCLESMGNFRQEMENELKYKPELGLYLQKSIIRYISLALFYGLVFGFIFSKIYVAPNYAKKEDNNNNNNEQSEESDDKTDFHSRL